MNTETEVRRLSKDERELTRWMLEHGKIEAQKFIEQLNNAEATKWQCLCGCASYKFKVNGFPTAPSGVHVLAEYVFGTEEDLAGIFIYESNGILSGVEVYGMAKAAPSILPRLEELTQN